jgi:hypothetical protein
MRRRVFIFINGILSNPGDSDGWTDRAVTWIHTRTPDGIYGEKFEYATGPLTRRLWQGVRAQAIARMVQFYHRAKYDVSLVGHSNGCDLIARVIDGLNVSVRSVHLFAPAADGADFARAIHEQAVGNVYLYGSTKDKALGLARVTGVALRRFGLGYGSLGVQHADFAASFPNHVTNCSNDTFGHSDWFARDTHFDATMRLIATNEGVPVEELPFTPAAP